MKVLIVIPAYNAEKTVGESIRSALAQTYDNVTVAPVSDGSNDNTWSAILNFYAEPRCSIFSWFHRGVQGTVNRMVEEFGWGYDAILKLDADDTLHPDYLKTVVPVMQNNPEVGVVSTDMQYFGEGSGVCQTGGCWPTNTIPSTSLIRRAAWTEVGGYDPEMVYEDWDLWLKIKKAGWKFEVVHQPLFNYRLGINARSKWQDTNKKEHEEQIRRRHG